MSFEIKGSLRTRPFASLLSDFAHTGRSGIVSLRRGDIRKRACFIQGTIRLAASNVRSERLSEFLVREEALPGLLAGDIDARLAGGERSGQILVGSGVLDGSAARDLMRRHILEILVPCFDWPTGSYEFREGVPDIAGEVNVEVPPIELFLERGRRRENEDAIANLSSRRDGTLRYVSSIAAELERVPLEPIEKTVLSCAIERKSIEELILLSGQDERSTLRSLQALVETGAIRLEFAIHTRKTADDAARPTDTYDVYLTRSNDDYLDLYKRMLTANHYQLLGVSVTATPEEIRTNYYQLARELHPDRFATPPLDAVKAEMEDLFRRITEAYNTLSNRLRRADYDATTVGTTSSSALPGGEVTPDPEVLARANFLRGKQLVDEGRFAKALEFAENAVSLDGSRPEYHLLLGRVRAQHPRLRESAIDAYNTGLTLDPTRTGALMELGRLYLQLGRAQEAERTFRSVLRWSSRHAGAKEELEKLKGATKAGFMGGLFGRGGSEKR